MRVRAAIALGVLVLCGSASAAESGRRPLLSRFARHSAVGGSIESKSEISLDLTGLSLPTLGGAAYEFKQGAPATVVNVYDAGSGFSQCLWNLNESIDELLTRANLTKTRFMFASSAKSDATARADVSALRTRVRSRMAALKGIVEPSAWAGRLVFMPKSITSSPRLSALLNRWPTVRDTATFTLGSAVPRTVPRLDARYDWLGWAFDPSGVFGNASVPMAYIGDGCQKQDSARRNLTGRVALVSPGGSCSYYSKLKAAAAFNASGAVVFAPRDQPVQDMTCTPTECADTSLAISATMVSYSVGDALRTALSNGTRVLVSFATVQVPGTDIAIDSKARAVQSWGGTGLGSGQVDGNPGDKSSKLYPRMSFLAWAGRWEAYRQRLSARLADKDATAVSVFRNESLRPSNGNCYGSSPYQCGPSSVVGIPQQLLDGGYRVELDMALGCAGSDGDDIQCPQWDHIVQMRVCCEKNCDAQNNGREIGRWMTAFGRREGRWLSDVTPLAALLRPRGGAAAHSPTDGSFMCNFTAYTAPWEGNQGDIPWVADLSLRFTPTTKNKAPAPRRIVQPWEGLTTETGGISQVFRWVQFNQSYASYFPTFKFRAPGKGARTRLVAVITGHGNDDNSCGEFCATKHVFTVNGKAEYSKPQLLPNTDTALGCAERVDTGVTPNEYGTWLYGRDGWCNGRNVEVWSVDVTEDLTPNRTNTLDYKGLWCPAPPAGADVEAAPACRGPDPGPPSTWQQAAPVMMVNVFLAFDE